jgi:hypothetical protein
MDRRRLWAAEEFEMRLAWGIMTVLFLGFTASGAASQGGEASSPPSSASQSSEGGTSQPGAKTEPAAQPKKKAESGAVSSKGRRRAAPKAGPAPEGQPRKIVVRQGGADEPTAQIVTGMAPAEADRERKDAEQLLSSTDDALQRLSAQTLDALRQETVSQIHNYMAGARSALKEGDIARAQTLAMKASLLASDLAKH